MPAHGRAGWAAIAIAIAVLVAAAPTGLAGVSQAKSKRCKASEVKRTVSYRRGARKDRAKGCAPKPGAVPGTVAAALPTVLKRTRAIATRLAPRIAKRARKRKAARRVARADRATDAALGRGAAPLATAAAVSTNTARSTVSGPPGTRSTMTRTITERSGNEPRIGRDGDLIIDTRSTRIGGSSKRKSISFKHDMDRCPDGGGIGRGPVAYTQHDRWVVGDVVQSEIGRFSGEVVAHFGDDARIASVEVTGTWSWSTETRRSGNRVARHAVSGGARADDFRQSSTGGTIDNHVDVRTTVTRATDDGTAISGAYLGLFTVVMPDLFIEEALDGIQRRALSGACVRVVPNEPTVHVSPASTAPVVAHLVDSAGTTFSGAITTTNERVAPQRADGNPDAQFTYLAPANASGTDFVRLEHTSRRGKANPGIVNIVIDSFDYRVLAATLNETVSAERPPDFAQCPASASQTNTMSLGPQPYDPSTSSDGHLFDEGASLNGQIRASGMASVNSDATGCDVGQEPPQPCSGTSSIQVDRDVTVEVDLPKAGGPASVQWFFNQDPTAGTGFENHGSCLTYAFHARTNDLSLGVRSVPRSVFESSGPAKISIDVQLDLPADQGGELHATERYSLTIQRVTG
jgi:hypothetical protein